MEVAARLSSKGQLTVPKAVREALDLAEGDNVVFRVEGKRAVLTRTTDFLSLAGTITVPAKRRNAAWDDVLRHTRTSRSTDRR
jgi:antitoxin PrlF